MKIIKLSLFFLFLAYAPIFGQSNYVHDFSASIEVPDVMSMASSPSHLYVLSKTEGLAVFRFQKNGLQWLYTSQGMQNRGDIIRTDSRFAYLYGFGRRLTVIEPTSILGVFSSTNLPQTPLAVARLQNRLYIAMGKTGMGVLSLSNAETVDTPPTFPHASVLAGNEIIDVVSSELNSKLFVLSSSRKLFTFNSASNTLTLESEISFNQEITNIFATPRSIYGATKTGKVFEIVTTGLSAELAAIGEQVQHIDEWEGRLLIRGNSGNVWVKGEEPRVVHLKSIPENGNYFTVINTAFWLIENNKLSRILIDTTESKPANSASFNLTKIPNQLLPYPRALLLPLEIEGKNPDQKIWFSARASVPNVVVKGNSLYWQPASNHLGLQWFTVFATNKYGDTDSLRFSVDVLPFNAPPRFSPVRPASIAANETYTIMFNAIDPETRERGVIRFLGVDLPDGSELDEKTGRFTWKPTGRHVGEHEFKVIATDQFGAAASHTIKLTVLEVSRDGSGG